jgi:hypothetical protein
MGGAIGYRPSLGFASSAATQDHYYWYDDLQQVTQHDCGDLDPSSTPPPASNRKFSPSTKPEIVLAPLTPCKMRILPPESGEVHSAQSPEPAPSA